MKLKSFAQPVIFVQLLCVLFLVAVVIGRILQVWQSHIISEDLAHASTQLSLRLLVPVVMLIGLFWLGAVLAKSLGSKTIVGGNILWPMATTLFAYFLVIYGLVAVMNADGHFLRAAQSLPSPEDAKYPYLVYKKEVPAFCNLAPSWMPIWLGIFVSLVGTVLSSLAYFLGNSRGDFLERAEEEAMLHPDRF